MQDELGKQLAEIASQRKALEDREQQAARLEGLIASSREQILAFCAEISSLQQEIEKVNVATPDAPTASGEGEPDPAMQKLRRDVRRKAMGV